MTREAGDAVVTRATGEKIAIDLRDVVATQDFVLKDHDVVVVAKAQMVFIQGHVRNTGQFVWTRDMTVAQLVTSAGGLTERGTYRGAYAKRLVKGKSTKVNVTEDDVVLPGDQVFIGSKLL